MGRNDDDFDGDDYGRRRRRRKSNNAGGIILAMIVWVVGLIAVITMLIAASEMSAAGHKLTILRSVGGGTVAEAFYQEVGSFGVANAVAMRGFAIATAMVSLALGGLLILRPSGWAGE